MFYGLGYVLTQWMFHGLLGKNMYSAAVWWSVLYILTRCCWLIALFISFVPLLIFCLAVLSVAKSRLGRLRIVDSCVSPLSSIWLCFLYLFKDFFFFFWCDLLLKTLLSLLQHCFCFYFWSFGHGACWILAPWPGIEPVPLALEGNVLTTGSPGNSLLIIFQSPVFHYLHRIIIFSWWVKLFIIV